jgi:hypothetical protein
MTKRTRAGRQQAARRRPQPRPPTPGGAPPGGAGGGSAGPGRPGGLGAPVEQDDGLTGAATDAEEAAPETRAPAARPAPAPVGARRVGRIDPASARRLKPQQKQQQAFAPLDPEDPAIPFDRVPYVPGDLRRVAIMAGLMIVLIIVAAVIVTHTVGA